MAQGESVDEMKKDPPLPEYQSRSGGRERQDTKVDAAYSGLEKCKNRNCRRRSELGFAVTAKLITLHRSPNVALELAPVPQFFETRFNGLFEFWPWQKFR